MSPSEVAVELARQEVEAPELGVTQQVLAVHDVRRDANGRPAPLRVDDTTEKDAHFVYFGLQERGPAAHAEPYHLVVAIRRSDDQAPHVSWSYVELATRVYLLIASDELHPDAITARVGIRPTKTMVKGSLAGYGRAARPLEKHYWQWDALLGTPAGMEERIAALIDRIHPAVAEFSALRGSCEARLVVVLEGWAGNPQFAQPGLDAAAIGVLAAIGASVDFDIYAFGPNMAEDGGATR